MGGLALGNALAGWYGPRLRHFLWVYAGLELTVAVIGVGLTYLLGALPGLLAPFTRSFLDVRWIENVVRLGTAFPLLLLPTTAMGATLPVLVGAVCRSDARFGPVLGRLYGWNTLGAVIGVAGAELILIARVGILGSAWIAALFNIGAAGAALWVWSRNEAMAVSALTGKPSAQASAAVMWRLLACAALMGGSLMALEVVVPLLSMFVVASTLAVSLCSQPRCDSGGWAAGVALARRRPDAFKLSSVIWLGSLRNVIALWLFPVLTGSMGR